MTESKLKKFALWGICIFFGILFFWVLIKFFLPVFLPFLISYALSLIISPFSAWLYKKTKIPKNIWAAFLIVLLSAAVSFLIWKLGGIIIKEAGDAANSLGEMLRDRDSTLNSILRKITDFFEKFSKGGRTAGSVSEMLTATLAKISGWVTDGAGVMISSAPSVVFSVVVTLISLFYFAMDSGKIRSDMEKYLPGKVTKRADEVTGICIRAAKRFLKAYLIIMAITFSELLVGFIIIGVKYAFLAALIVSVVDLLPILGTGTVLIPWAVILFLTGEGGKAVAMAALCAVMYIIRQMIEPKIVGNTAGVHPLLALASVYAGYRLSGIGGMIVGPLILYAFSAFWEEKKDG